MFNNRNIDNNNSTEQIKTSANSTYPKGGGSFSKDSFVVIGSSVFQINICGKNPALLVAAKRVCLESMSSTNIECFTKDGRQLK